MMVDDLASPADLAAFAVHGGDLMRAQRAFPAAPRPWLDLSTGLNPVPYRLPSLAAADWTRLPDPTALAALEEAAGRAYGVGAGDTVLAAPGTQAIIQRLPLANGGRIVRVLGPTYGEHAFVWRAAGREVAMVEAVEALAAADVAVVVNPNNPDGRLLGGEALRWLAGRLAIRGGLLVVDEAFVDLLDPACSLVPGGLPEGAVVLRSFGKTFGLGGLRLGFLIAAAGLTHKVRAALGPWAVSGPAIAVGRAALADADWVTAARARLAQDGRMLDAILADAGFAVLGGTPLFRLTGHPEAATWFRQLAAAGILVRPFADATRLRFGIPGSDADRARLAAALRVGALADV